MKLVKTILYNPATLIIIWISFLSTYIFGIIRYFLITKSEYRGGVVFTLSLAWHALTVLGITFMVVFGLWIIRYLQNRLNSKNITSFFVIGVSSFFLFIISNLLLNMENANYGNYLYSQFGLAKDSMQLLSNISLICVLFFVWFITFKNEIRKSLHFKITILNFVSLFSLGILFWYAIPPIFNWRDTMDYAKYSYERQFEDFDIIKSFDKVVPLYSNIILPEQSLIWPAISNPVIVRYFLFPRTIISSSYVINQINANKLIDVYFIRLKNKRTGSLWPIINENKKEIVFNEGYSIFYTKLTKNMTEDGIEFYHVEFK